MLCCTRLALCTGSGTSLDCVRVKPVHRADPARCCIQCVPYANPLCSVQHMQPVQLGMSTWYALPMVPQTDPLCCLQHCVQPTHYGQCMALLPAPHTACTVHAGQHMLQGACRQDPVLQAVHRGSVPFWPADWSSIPHLDCGPSGIYNC